MRLPEVKQAVGYSRAAIYLKMKRGEFPKSCQIGPRAIGWDSLAISAWINSKIDTAAGGAK